jgi:CheY-like chemotaxis protein
MRDGKNLILVVDDDRDVLDTLRIILEGGGHAVEEATTGEEGLRRYRAERPDLVIVDLMMEEVDAGTNLVKEIRALGDGPPIYLLSSVGDALHSATDAAELGLAGVFQKPVDASTILRTLEARLPKVT